MPSMRAPMLESLPRGVVLSLFLVACGGGDGADAGGSSDDASFVDAARRDASTQDDARVADVESGPVDAASPGDAFVEECLARSEVVHFETDDGVTLEADYQTPGPTAVGAVILLHMSPLRYDRRNFPASFRSALVARGFTVLNVDRRGAGGSTGNPEDAASGARGVNDAIAARRYVLSRACAPNAAEIRWVGASNGSTTVLDFVVESATEDIAPPHSIVWMSPGAYTENQHSVASARFALETTPMLWVYPEAERDFPELYRASAPSAWLFLEESGAAHGTDLFADHPSLEGDIAAFLAGSFVAPDAGVDAGLDAGLDAGVDAGLDAATDDAATNDAGPDDAATGDGGATSDAASSDGGVPIDAAEGPG